MELWLDTIDLDVIADANQLGILAGVTTNPTILSKADTVPETKLRQILDVQSGMLAVQVLALDADEMITQARHLSAIDPRIIIKIPVTAEGIRAINLLREENIPTMATAIFETKQVLLAAMAGAIYVAPYVSKIETVTGRSYDILVEMQTILVRQNYATKLLAASINSIDQAMYCAAGLPAITVPASIYQALLTVPDGTAASLEKFADDWQEGDFTSESLLF